LHCCNDRLSLAERTSSALIESTIKNDVHLLLS
jgi:hypothetical protein